LANCFRNGLLSALSITELKVLKTSCEVIEKIDTLGLDVGRLSGVGCRLTPCSRCRNQHVLSVLARATILPTDRAINTGSAFFVVLHLY
jgi:hypothetical protein